MRAAFAAVGFPLTIAQYALSRRQWSKYKPPGQRTDIGPYKLHAIVQGEGTPTIVLDAGMGGCALDWSLVQPQLAQAAMVVSYDRAGLGWSAQGQHQATTMDYVHDLRELLRALHREPPYILVGHSFGGLNMQLYTAMYPEEVAGLVLVDSVTTARYLDGAASEDRQKAHKKFRKMNRWGYLLSPLGIPRMMKLHIGAKRLPQDIQPVVTSLGYRSNAYRTNYLEMMNAPVSAAQLREKQPLHPDMPVMVLTAGKQEKKLWLEQQQELLALTRCCKQTIVEDSWHSIHIYQPDAVVKAVKEICDQAAGTKYAWMITETKR